MGRVDIGLVCVWRAGRVDIHRISVRLACRESGYDKCVFSVQRVDVVGICVSSGGGIFCSSFSEWIYGVYVCGKWDGKIWM
jgi:hypothetical protein